MQPHCTPTGNPPPLAPIGGRTPTTPHYIPSIDNAANSAVLKGVLHLTPAIMLVLALVGMAVRDVFTDPPPVKVVIKEEPAPIDLIKPSFVVQIEEDAEGRLQDAEAGFVHLIEDEPPEQSEQVLAPVKVTIEDEPSPQPQEKVHRLPIDPTPYIRYQYNFNMRFGMTVIRNHHGQFLNKQITYSRDGSTSNTRIKINGQDLDYGSGFGGQWIARGEKLPDDKDAEVFQRSYSTYVIRGIHITQILEIVPSQQPVMVNGQQTRVLDTVLVRYVTENKSGAAVQFGLRSHVDTLIGSNDGVPFTVPGIGLINTFAHFPTANQVPAFLQALEFGNLQNPGLVAHMTLKLGGKYESPNRLLLTYWPGGNAPWEVPLRNFSIGRPDSAVIIYWPEKLLQPNERRELAFAYGLGSVSAEEGQGKLGVTLAGSFEPGQTFSVTAYVNNPVAGQTATLEVPPGLAVVGNATLPVPPAKGALSTSLVTWQSKVLETGKFRIQVTTSNGLVQAKTITIQRPEAPTGGKVAFDVTGDFQPGKTFTVAATVTDPLAGQSLTLELPDGLQLASGVIQQQVPPATEGKSSIAWNVRVLKPGRFPVRVASSTGVTQTKTITILSLRQGEGQFTLDLSGEYEPGKFFTVSAKVEKPLPKQTLTLELPSGLQRISGDETVPVPTPANEKTCGVVSWRIKVMQTGKFGIRVGSNTGIVRKKTLIIGKIDPNKGRFQLVLQGEIQPGKTFSLLAHVTDPVPEQKLSLVLPKQLQSVDSPLTQSVPPLFEGDSKAEVRWQIRVNDVGKLPIRVESSTGVYRVKTIVLRKQESKTGIFGQ